MNIDLTPVFQAIIALLAALVTYKLIPWIVSKTTSEQRKSLSAAVNVLVYAAEQIYGAGHGAEKLKYVEARLKERGFNVDTDAIEAAVKSMSWRQDVTDMVAGQPIEVTGEDESGE